MSRKLTASVVGCGMGGRLSMDGLTKSDRFELLAVADVSAAAREKAAADYGNLRPFATHQEMFDICPTDVVCVSTWAPSHRDITHEALKLPHLRGILVEKPLGDTAAAGRDILDAVRKRGIPMAVPHGLLVAPHVGEIVRRVRGGEIGELKLIEIQNTGWDIINAGIHWLNFAVTLVGGEPMAFVMAACDTSTRTYRDGMQVETLGVTYAQTQSGIRIVMNTGDKVNVSREGKGCLFRIVGTAGSIEFWAWESAYLICSREYPGGKLIEVPKPTRTRHQIHLENMVGQIDAGKCDYTVAESSLTALELCEGAYLSHRHRCCVTFSLSAFTPPAPTDWNPGIPYSGTGGGRDGRTV